MKKCLCVLGVLCLWVASVYGMNNEGGEGSGSGSRQNPSEGGGDSDGEDINASLQFYEDEDGAICMTMMVDREHALPKIQGFLEKASRWGPWLRTAIDRIDNEFPEGCRMEKADEWTGSLDDQEKAAQLLCVKDFLKGKLEEVEAAQLQMLPILLEGAEQNAEVVDSVDIMKIEVWREICNVFCLQRQRLSRVMPVLLELLRQREFPADELIFDYCELAIEGTPEETMLLADQGPWESDIEAFRIVNLGEVYPDTSRIVQWVCKELSERWHSVKSLDLSGCRVQGAGAIAVANLFHSAQGVGAGLELEALLLGDNPGIGSDVVIVLLQNLGQYPSTLKQLSLMACPLEDRVAGVLADVLFSPHCKLESIDLEACGLDSDDPMFEGEGVRRLKAAVMAMKGNPDQRDVTLVFGEENDDDGIEYSFDLAGDLGLLRQDDEDDDSGSDMDLTPPRGGIR